MPLINQPESEIKKIFHKYLNAYCELFNVEKDLVLSKSRDDMYAKARVMIFYAVDNLYPGNKNILQHLIGRKHPYYVHARKVHETLISLYSTYRSDYEMFLDYAAIKEPEILDQNIMDKLNELKQFLMSNKDISRFIVNRRKIKIDYRNGDTFEI